MERTKNQTRLVQIALRAESIKVIDELIEMEGTTRLGGASLSKADVLNDILIRKGAKKIRDFYYSQD
jgi:hypothetical protein